MTTVETPIVLSNDEENPLALSVSHVAKSFRLPTEQASGLKTSLPELDQRHQRIP